jgi:hypothetical protein
VNPDSGGTSPTADGERGGAGPAEDLEVLHQTVDQLTRENEALKASGDPPAKGKAKRRATTTVSWVLLVLACLLAVVSVLTVFVRNQLLNTDTYVATMAPLASNPAVQTQLATRVSEELIARTDLQARVKDVLPARAGFLAEPIAAQVQNATYTIALRVVQNEKFEQLWIAANRASHKQLVALLTGSSEGAISSKDGKVTIDLGRVEVTLKKDLAAKGITVFNNVPAVKGVDYVLFQSSDLPKIQRLTKALNSLAVLLPILTLLLLAASVVLARNRRRGLVRAAAGLALSMVVVLVVVNVARNQYLSGVNPSGKRAAQAAVIDTVSAPLTDGVRTVLIVAAVVAVLVVIVGLAVVQRLVSGRRLPGWMTGGPVHGFAVAHRKGLQWGVLAVGLLILVVWNKPTVLVAIVVVLVTLAVVGLVGLFATRRPVAPPGGSGPADPPAPISGDSGGAPTELSSPLH